MVVTAAANNLKCALFSNLALGKVAKAIQINSIPFTSIISIQISYFYFAYIGYALLFLLASMVFSAAFFCFIAFFIFQIQRSFQQIIDE